MRIYIFVFLLMISLSSFANATTVDLTDGRTMQGDITNIDAKSLQITVDGVSMTYYPDEIKDIDGKSYTDSLPQAPLPASSGAVPNTSVVSPTVGTIDPEKRALILKFIDVFGTRQALINNFDMMTKQIEKEKPDEAQKIRDRVKIDEIIERLLPIYDRNFTSDDLKAFIQFYGSPEGQKLMGTIPVLMKESVQESIKYMQEKFPEVKE